VIVGYAKRERSYAGFAVGIVLFFLVGLFIGLNCAENPVCDILDAHADGMAYGLYAAENGQDRMLALAAVKEWKEVSEKLRNDRSLANAVYRRAKGRSEPLHLSVVLEVLDLLETEK